jgi:serine/threonine protein phosphatase PrpC
MHVLFSSASHRGARRYNEDRLFTATTAEGTLAAVFDGHGGEQCVKIASDKFVAAWADTHEAGKDPLESLKETYKQISAAVDWMEEGTTASALFIPFAGDDVYVAVLGDSPIILQQPDGSIHVSPEHNVRSNIAERTAAQNRGGFYDGGYICMRFSGPGLQMARAFGNAHLRPVVISEPEVYTTKMGKFALVASDGVVDPSHRDGAASVTDIVNLIESGADAAQIVMRAVNIPTNDNATAILLRTV